MAHRVDPLASVELALHLVHQLAQGLPAQLEHQEQVLRVFLVTKQGTDVLGAWMLL